MGRKAPLLLGLLGFCLGTTQVQAAQGGATTRAVVVVGWGMRMVLPADPKAGFKGESRKNVALNVVQGLTHGPGQIDWRLLVVAPRPPSPTLPAKPIWLADQDSRRLASKLKALPLGLSDNFFAAVDLAAQELGQAQGAKKGKAALILLLGDAGTSFDGMGQDFSAKRRAELCRDKLQRSVAAARAKLDQVLLINIGGKGRILAGEDGTEFAYSGDTEALVTAVSRRLMAAETDPVQASPTLTVAKSAQPVPPLDPEDGTGGLPPPSAPIAEILQALDAERQQIQDRRKALLDYAHKYGLKTSRAEAYGQNYPQSAHARAKVALTAGRWEAAVWSLSRMQTAAAQKALAAWARQSNLQAKVFTDPQLRILAQAKSLQKNSIRSREQMCSRYGELRRLADALEAEAERVRDPKQESGQVSAVEVLPIFFAAACKEMNLVVCDDHVNFRPDLDALTETTRRHSRNVETPLMWMDFNLGCPSIQFQGVPYSRDCIDLDTFLAMWKNYPKPCQNSCACPLQNDRLIQVLARFPADRPFCAAMPPTPKLIAAVLQRLQELEAIGGRQAAQRLRARLPRLPNPPGQRTNP